MAASLHVFSSSIEQNKSEAFLPATVSRYYNDRFSGSCGTHLSRLVSTRNWIIAQYMMPFAGCKFFFTILAVESTQSIVLSFPPLSAIKSGTNNSKVEPSDSRYERWTNPGKVSYVLDDSYSKVRPLKAAGLLE